MADVSEGGEYPLWLLYLFTTFRSWFIGVFTMVDYESIAILIVVFRENYMATLDFHSIIIR